MMRTRFAVSLMTIASLTAAGAVVAETSGPPPGGWGEPHLSTVPRDTAETARIAAIVAPPDDFSKPEPFEDRPGGAATVFGVRNRAAFSQPSANMPFDAQMDFRVGDGFFRRLWVTAPSSTVNADGLGPIHNARSCQRCHLKDGRGRPPDGPDDNSASMFLRVSIPDRFSDLDAETRQYLEAAPDPVYGLQIQDKSIAGVPAEGRMTVQYEPLLVEMGDGEAVELRRPVYRVANPGYGPLHPAAMLSPRVAQQMIGLGLLEAIPEATILAAADPDDADGDGISGRAQRVWSREYDQWMLGRFGHKAGNPTIRAQSAAAFSSDMGLSTTLHPDPYGECRPGSDACRETPHGGDAHGIEISDQMLDLVSVYARNLAPPARRRVNRPETLQGKAVFHQLGCASCHIPKFVTHRLTDQSPQSFQLIWPHTDLLLHDMGKALADNRSEWRANGREWRTAPLWGISMTKVVSGHVSFLHDGRARSLTEAVLWHGGEAESAREGFRLAPASDRETLIAYLESL